MDPAELIKKVRKVQILTTRLVDEVVAGGYHSAFRGTGMEFDEVREYQAGDDVRTIDWNVTARTGHPYVKRFTEERELTVMILVDGSGSAAFGSGSQSKLELATEISAVIAFSAIANNDKVGLVIFTDRIDLYLPPRKGKAHVLRVIREILGFAPRRARTDLALALEFLGRVQRRRSVAFLLSDFFDAGYEAQLSLAAKRHDLIPVRVTDEREERLPDLGLLRLEDAESGEQVLLDSGAAAGRLGLERGSKEFGEGLEDLFRKREMDAVCMRTGGDYILPLRRLFRQRERRRR